ncbi:MAG: GGDEF domain-containing protein [Pseudohongiella sp.]|nr:GGDEF domain-containing protein [Pseudohongiella sp.]MDO9518818.1 GGDEF domain-containing protein [Pseudohongiella sp.]MDP2128794.1 GGDEF domain-containing protein [Pseudohongiella sp.]
MTGLDLDYRHRTTLRFSRALMIIMVVGSIGRTFIAYLPDFVVWLGFFNVALAVVAYLVIRSKRLLHYESQIVVALCFIYVYPLFFTTGGVNSQYVYFMTLIPMVAALVGSVRMTWTVCVIQLLLIVLLFMLGDSIPDLTGYPFIEEKTRVRSVWLMVGVIIASYFGVYFRTAYDEQSVMLDNLASVDYLTGLLNRRALKARLDNELQRSARSAQPLSVLMMDVDFFKQFNDQHGHAAGDDCLIKVARCLRKHTRAEDIVSRYGGEEFLIVLINADVKETLTVAEKLRQAIADLDPLACGDNISVTIGAASMAPATSLDQLPEAEDLIREADEALYRGKEAGRNRVEYFNRSETKAIKSNPAYT